LVKGCYKGGVTANNVGFGSYLAVARWLQLDYLYHHHHLCVYEEFIYCSIHLPE
jgi:hypothetical protein